MVSGIEAVESAFWSYVPWIVLLVIAGALAEHYIRAAELRHIARILEEQEAKRISDLAGNGSKNQTEPPAR